MKKDLNLIFSVHCIDALSIMSAENDDETKIVAETEYEGEEDQPQDWKAFNRNTGPVEALPKRGDKEFELDGTNFQTSLIEDARREMYVALDETRGQTTKQLLVAVWIPERNQALVPVGRGNFFKDMGKPTNVFVNAKKLKQSIWLDGIETVYLVERGSLTVYLGNDEFNEYLAQGNDDEEFDYKTKLFQLTLSHIYSLAFSDGGLVDKYQVYSYLKRLGYVVQDFSIVNESCSQILNYKVPTSFVHTMVRKFVPLGHLFTRLMVKIGVLARPFSSSLHFESKHYFNYTSVFRTLQIIPSYHTYDCIPSAPASNDYKLTFNVWKPSASFSKKNPPIPDFQLCLINTQQQNFPSLPQIQSLFNDINYYFPHQPDVVPTKKKPTKKPKSSTTAPTKRELREKRQNERQSKLDPKVQQRNEYLKAKDTLLRNGSSGRSVILAIIDSGIISFTKLCELDFTLSDNSVRSKLNVLYPPKSNDHGTMWLEKY